MLGRFRMRDGGGELFVQGVGKSAHRSDGDGAWVTPRDRNAPVHSMTSMSTRAAVGQRRSRFVAALLGFVVDQAHALRAERDIAVFALRGVVLAHGPIRLFFGDRLRGMNVLQNAQLFVGQLHGEPESAIDAVTVQTARDGYVAGTGLGRLRFLERCSDARRELWDTQRKAGHRSLHVVVPTRGEDIFLTVHAASFPHQLCGRR
jgi:hypothetical protein